jgi:leucyl aminopeptidase (aminopeptidase T)
MKMTDVRIANLKLILDKIARVKNDTRLLVVADDFARTISLAYDIVDLVNSMGGDAVLSIFKRRTFIAEEPPPLVAVAIKNADVVIEITETSEIGHSSAVKEAADSGLQRCVLLKGKEDELSLQKPILLEDLDMIKKRTEQLVDIETKGKKVRLTTPYGTDISFSIDGRSAIGLHPMGDAHLVVAPTYGEVAIAPVERTTEGVVVVDSFVQGWDYLLPKPIRFEVKKGRVLIETVISEIPAQAERFKKLITMDEMANNCAAEFGTGTSHVVAGPDTGYMMEKGRIGHVHIAVGRNYDLGGTSRSIIHNDSDMTHPTVVIDDITIIENGEFRF